MGPYQGPRAQNTQGLPRKCLGIQLPSDQEHAFWREEIRKVVTYSRTSCPAGQARDRPGRHRFQVSNAIQRFRRADRRPQRQYGL